MRWIIITGEYPPQDGGVSDYTWAISTGLAAIEDEVQVWAPPSGAQQVEQKNVIVHRLPDRFGFASRRALEQAFDNLPHGARVLIQYVPQAFGCHGMNLPFAL